MNSMQQRVGVSRAVAVAAVMLVGMIELPFLAVAGDDGRIVRAAAPEGAIDHVLVIVLENESFSATFGPTSPAVYLNTTLLQQGELITNYFATSHVSLGNYVSMVSGQESTPSQNNDCLNLASLSSPPLVGGFTNVFPGTDTTEPSNFPGQVVGDGCVFPAPTQTTHGARTIGDQLDEDRGRGDFENAFQPFPLAAIGHRLAKGRQKESIRQIREAAGVGRRAAVSGENDLGIDPAAG